MSQSAKASRARWKFLDAYPPPSADRQHELTLACASARSRYRLAVLRSPKLPASLIERARSADIRIRVPVRPRRLVPLALALCKEDPDGMWCDEALEWIRQQPNSTAVVRHIERARRRWLKARSEIIAANLRLGASIVRKRFFYSPLSQEDLLQEAAFGLARAADRFDPHYGVKFSTYATWWVRHAAQRAIHNTMRVVRLPAHVCDDLTRYAVAIHHLGPDAEEDALANHTKMALPKLRKIAKLYATQGFGPVSFDAPLPGLDKPTPMIDQFEAPAPSMDDSVFDEERANIVKGMLRQLPSRDRGILERRFGFGDDGEITTLASLGRDLDLSRERVRQLEKRALRELADAADLSLCSTSR